MKPLEDIHTMLSRAAGLPNHSNQTTQSGDSSSTESESEAVPSLAAQLRSQPSVSPLPLSQKRLQKREIEDKKGSIAAIKVEDEGASDSVDNCKDN